MPRPRSNSGERASPRAGVLCPPHVLASRSRALEGAVRGAAWEPGTSAAVSTTARANAAERAALGASAGPPFPGCAGRVGFVLGTELVDRAAVALVLVEVLS